MDRLLLTVALVAVAGVVALVLARRRPDAPTQPTWSVPAQLDRHDFTRPDAPWLVVVFSSRTCDACAAMVERAELLASDAVAVQVVAYQDDPDLHRRYGIDAVPTTLVAGADGVVGVSFVGGVTSTDLWGAVAELREPGSAPPCHPD